MCKQSFVFPNLILSEVELWQTLQCTLGFFLCYFKPQSIYSLTLSLKLNVIRLIIIHIGTFNSIIAAIRFCPWTRVKKKVAPMGTMNAMLIWNCGSNQCECCMSKLAFLGLRIVSTQGRCILLMRCTQVNSFSCLSVLAQDWIQICGMLSIYILTQSNLQFKVYLLNIWEQLKCSSTANFFCVVFVFRLNIPVQMYHCSCRIFEDTNIFCILFFVRI